MKSYSFSYRQEDAKLYETVPIKFNNRVGGRFDIEGEFSTGYINHTNIKSHLNHFCDYGSIKESILKDDWHLQFFFLSRSEIRNAIPNANLQNVKEIEIVSCNSVLFMPLEDGGYNIKAENEWGRFEGGKFIPDPNGYFLKVAMIADQDSIGHNFPGVSEIRIKTEVSPYEIEDYSIQKYKKEISKKINKTSLKTICDNIRQKMDTFSFAESLNIFDSQDEKELVLETETVREKIYI